MTTGHAMIELHNVTKYHERERVLDNVSLVVDEGQMLGLVGPGGSGKTLLLKVLCGLVKPDSGSVLIDGVDITRISPVELSDVRKRIGMLFQNYALFDFLNVEDNIAFPLRRAGGMGEREILERVNELLERVNLPGINYQFPNELSGGMKKRVTFARAVIAKPPIIFYDDPTMGLDPVTSSKIFIMLEEFQRTQRTTSICITHDLLGARDICDEWAMIDEGRLVFRGDLSAVRASSDPFVTEFWDGAL